MSLLLDALEDGGLDRETIHFLVEALVNAEPSDWGAVMEPFLDMEKPLKVLEAEPAELQRTVKALELAVAALPNKAEDIKISCFTVLR